MTATTQKLSRAIDLAIPALILLQAGTVSISIAASSILFGAWLFLWLVQIFIDRRNALSVFTLPDLRIINIFIALYFIAEISSRIFAVYPDTAFDNIKRLLLFSIFYASVGKVTGIHSISVMLVILSAIVSLASCAELITYAVTFGDLITKMPFSEIRIDYFNYPLTIAEIKMMIVLSLFPMLTRDSGLPVKRSVLILILAPIVLSMLLTQSRNVYLAFFICLLVYGIFTDRKFLYGLVILTTAALIFLPSSVTQRVKSIFDLEHPSNKARIVMWQTGWQMLMDDPLSGVGDSKFREIYETYKTPEFHSEGVHLHSNLFMILATTGFPGFFAFCGFFIALIVRQIQLMKMFSKGHGRELTLGSLLVILSFIISGFFEWSFGDHEVMTVFFFLVSVPFIIKKEKDADSSIELHSS